LEKTVHHDAGDALGEGGKLGQRRKASLGGDGEPAHLAGLDHGIGRRDRAEITWLTPLATSWVICAADLSLSLDHLVGAGASTSRSVSISNSPSCNSDYSVSGWRPKAPARRKATAELIRREQALWRTLARELHRPQ
jgi:hypothetical protein